MLTEFENCLMR